MNGDDTEKNADDPSLEDELNKQAEEASGALKKRAEKLMKVSEEQASEAGESVRRAIQERAKKLAEEMLTGTADTKGNKAAAAKASAKATGKKTKNKQSTAGQKKKKASKKKRKSG